MDTGTLERALAGAGLQADVRWQEVTGSTNQVALAMAADGAPEWSIAAAGHQTAGRGRLGRTWEDQPGSALMCSLVLRPTALDPQDGGWIPLMAGAALAQACRSLTGADIRCKWPNDLLLGGAKVGGILVESLAVDDRLSVAVVGMGLNLASPAGIEGAAGLGVDVDPEALLTAYIRELVDLYRPESSGFIGEVSESWKALSATLGRHVRAITLDGREIGGIATGLGSHGGLIVGAEGGPVEVTSAQILHLD